MMLTFKTYNIINVYSSVLVGININSTVLVDIDVYSIIDVNVYSIVDVNIYSTVFVDINVNGKKDQEKNENYSIFLMVRVRGKLIMF
jgi:hypothetical protein